MNAQLLDKLCSHAYSFRDTVINTFELSQYILKNKIPGAFVECGVAAGAQIGAMQAAIVEAGQVSGRTIFAYDSFEGIPMAGPKDDQQPGVGPITHNVNVPQEQLLVSSGATAHTVENVKKNFDYYALPTNNINMVKGWFEHTIPQTHKSIGPIALLRLDGDLYNSTKVCLDHLFQYVVPGGIIIIDDYALTGARKAVTEFLWNNKITAKMNPVAPVENGVVWFFKEDKRNDRTPTANVQEEVSKVTLTTTAKPMGSNLFDKFGDVPTEFIEGTEEEVVTVSPIPNYSQNNEQEIILMFFKKKIHGWVLDIGANDGKTFSNSHALINHYGWSGILLEPSPRAFKRLKDLYKGYDRVKALCLGIADKTGTVVLNESGAFEGIGDEVGLLSCVDPKEMDRWGDKVDWTPVKAQMLSFSDFYSMLGDGKWAFDFINIDAEGMDLVILQQINLTDIGCQCFCIEHNGIPEMMSAYREYATSFGFIELSCNGENLLFGKP